VTGATGWLENLLRWAGVDPQTASHVQSAVGKPVAAMVVVLVAVAAGALGNRVIRRWIGSAARRAASRAESPRAEARAVAITAMVASLWRLVVGVLAFLSVLGVIGINLTPFLAGATVIGATIGFGAQSMVRDLLAGFFLVVEDQFGIGDSVAVGEVTGVVEDMSLRVTRLRAQDGTVVFVPNGEIRQLANRSRGWARAIVEVDVPATADVDTVVGAVRRAADDIQAHEVTGPLCLDTPRIDPVVRTTADTLTSRVTVTVPHGERDRVELALREALARRLRHAGVFGPPPLEGGPTDDGPPSRPDPG